MTPVGLLTSQIGYDLGRPMRALVRGKVGTLNQNAYFEVRRESVCVSNGPVVFWGEKWNSLWWIIDFSDVTEAGRYEVAVFDGQDECFGADIEVGESLLWNKTWWCVGVDQAERRARLAKNRVGWQDCGSHWQEANSHAAFLIGLLDLLERAPQCMNVQERERLERQVVNGCDFLSLLQDRATDHGHGVGSLVHEIPAFEHVTLPGDAVQSAVAWARAARLLSPGWMAKKVDYAERAARAFTWFQSAKPCGARGFSPVAHGVPEEFVPPDEHLTCDLLMAMWSSWELSRLNFEGDKALRFEDMAMDLARQIGARQVQHESGQVGLWGYFRTFGTCDLPEKAWLHSLGKGGIGSDVTATFPHYLVPFFEMLRARPDHSSAGIWRRLLRNFADGYFLPACHANPFGLLPLGVFEGEGLLWFAGLWHGMNAVYGLAAALALEFEREFGDPEFSAIAAANLGWIAGLNAGLTSENLFASHIWSVDVPDGVALPISMICGIGERTAGNWLAVRGAICNGFSTGDQFQFDVAPTNQNDGPHSFTDEDWIPHAGGWLSALSRLDSGCSTAI